MSGRPIECLCGLDGIVRDDAALAVRIRIIHSFSKKSLWTAYESTAAFVEAQ